MTTVLSQRIQRIKPSPTLALAARAKELKAQGKKIIDLTVGEPDFFTPEHIKQAAIAALNNNLTKYTPVDGLPELKRAICDKLARENQLTYDPKQILVSVGAKHSIYNLMQAVIDPNDEVIIPEPYWVSYPDMVLLADGKPVTVASDKNHKIVPASLEKAITARTKMVIINSPSNPSGVAYCKEELTALAQVLLKYPQILIMSDDIYEHILWNHLPFTNILNVAPELYDRTIVINGVSKSYAMTGWRIGYAAGPATIITAMKNLQSQSTSNPTSIAQAAAIAALQQDQTCVHEMMQVFKQRHDYLVAALNQIPGFQVTPADGAFYLLPDVTGAMQATNCKSDMEFADLLLNKAEIAVVPGTPFGAPGFMRLSYATSMELLQDAVGRIQNLLLR